MFARLLQRLRPNSGLLSGTGQPPGGSASRIPENLWTAMLQDHPFLNWRSREELDRLRSLCDGFLRRKEFHGVGDFTVTDSIALAVAAQACLPVLRLGLQPYEGFVGIVMHEGPVRARREVADDLGLVHTYEEELVGEAQEGGPVMLSWHGGVSPADSPPATRAFNVVIHEFVHLLDLLDGEFDGTPPLPADDRARWQATMQTAFDRFDERSACGYDSIIDDYGAQDIGEFFAVSAEAFFTAPRALGQEQPELYRLYRDFFDQDPAAHQPG